MKTSILTSSVLLALAACGSKSTAPKTKSPDQTVDAGPPVFAKLFEMGATWKFSVHSEDRDFESECSVERAEQVDGVELAQIGCEKGWPGSGNNLLFAVWAQNAQGLWHLATWPAVAPQLDPNQMTISKKGDAWCYEETSAAICFDAAGPTEGSFGIGKFTRVE